MRIDDTTTIEELKTIVTGKPQVWCFSGTVFIQSYIYSFRFQRRGGLQFQVFDEVTNYWFSPEDLYLTRREGVAAFNAHIESRKLKETRDVSQ